MKIGKLKLYLETTVFNYYFDEDRTGHEDVLQLFEAIEDGKFEVYTSELVIRELEKAKEPKRSKMLSLVECYKPQILENSDNVKHLGQLYIVKRVLSRLHIFLTAYMLLWLSFMSLIALFHIIFTI